VDNLYESLRLRRCHAMNTQMKQQAKQQQRGGKPVVTWSRERAAALRSAANQRKPNACNCNCK